MAFVMSFEAPDGNTNNNSYWRVVRVVLDSAEKTAGVMIYGYRNQAARNTGKVPIAQKAYDVGPAIYDDYFSTAKLAIKDPMAWGYQIAKDTKDVQLVPGDPKVSFFASASNI